MLPHLRGKLTGMAFRVPVATVSVVDLTAKLKRPIGSQQEINDLFKSAASGELKGIMDYTDDYVVSSDFR